MTETIHAPDNAETIDALYVFLSVDAGGDGLVAFQMGDTMWPMVATNLKTVEWMKGEAEKIAVKSGKRIVLARFDRREDIWSTSKP